MVGVERKKGKVFSFERHATYILLRFIQYVLNLYTVDRLQEEVKSAN